MPTLNWIGKEKVVSHHQDVPYRVLEHKYGFTADNGEQTEPTNSGNKIINGDNLEALKSLLPEYEGKVKCIYIDPPYNTGNENWVYNDNVNHPKIKKWLGEVVGKDGEDLTRHDKWLCMMYPRLKLLHKLLADDGAIFISIDDNEQANLKLICDEIFGVRNFLSNIVWERSDSPRMDAQFYSTKHEYILNYSKNIAVFNISRLKLDNENLPKHYNKRSSDGKAYYLKSLRAMGSGDDTREARPTMFYSIKAPNGEDVYPLKQDGSEGRWRWKKDTYEKQKDRIEFIKSNNGWSVYTRIFAENSERPAETLWNHTDVGSNRTSKKTIKEIFSNSSTFDFPKPFQLIKRMLELSTEKDSIILDSFAGSGTTAHAVLNLNEQDNGNRKFILVEMEDYANDITAERVKRVTKGYGTGAKAVAGTGGAFDFYELGLPLFDENLNLNEKVGLAKIREYIWFSETRTSFKEPNKEPYFLGKKDESAYYFIYEKDRLTTLDFDALELIKTKGEQYVIYADNCLLPKDFMAKKNIIFKKIPRDITRF
ncbi:site-specific DNA-methyltransferase [Polaribacter gangjinensis]|uniref:site-specific DNA-methyltransferase (adenine-specific) n=1 Tax=Polaribacter gangjinensis TaxID=574710 RepID=A0A2S7W9I6_9FLAO|nr:site-specific DNA-methyltransferase [Polaribacter gangjinensis]PQJ74288.1 type III restriction endonuclease subunit M [Polaribacter gangjinensis]